MLVLYIPYLIAVYVLDSNLNKKQYLLVFVFALPSLISLIFSIYFYGTIEQEDSIFKSLSDLNYPINGGGAITRLHYSAYDGFLSVLVELDHYVSYIAVVGLSLVAFIPLYRRFESVLENRLVLALIVCSAVGSVIVAIVALDWGRFIYINLVSLFILSLASQKDIDNHFTPNKLIIVLFILWAMCFRIPHAGDKVLAQSAGHVNLLNFITPIYHLTSGSTPPPR